MPHYNDVYISKQDFEILLYEGKPYNGFVEELGYAYTSNFSIPPIHLQKYNPPGRVHDNQSFFQNGFVQYLDISPEMRLMSVKHSHKVKAGDTLTSISQRYGISIQAIKDANSGINWAGERKCDKILAGEDLKLPKEGGGNLADNSEIKGVGSGNSFSGPTIAQTNFEHCLCEKLYGRDKVALSGGASYGLYVAASAGSVWDVYNNFAYNHTSYPTTKGIMKPYSDFAGRNMSQQASKYFRKSTGVKWAGNVGTGLMVFQSGYNYYNGDRSTLNYIDGSVGLMGLGNAASLQWASFGSGLIAPFVAWYGGLRLMMDASGGERMQIEDNIMNNRDPLYNVYNPSLGF